MTHLVSSGKVQGIRKKAPQLIAATILIALTVYLVAEISEDILIEGVPITGGPVVNAIITFTENVTSTVKSWGYLGVLILMLLESSSLPIPSEVVLPFAGYLVSTGQLNFWATTAVATVSGIAGSLIDYYIGLRGGNLLIQRRVLGRVLFSTSQLNVAAGWFNKHGASTVFVSRLIPGFRTIISFPAGAVKMPIAKFVAYTTAGCLLWNGVLIYFGYFLGSNWRQVAGISHYLIIATIAILALVFISYLIWRKTRKKMQLHNHVS